MLSIFRCTCLFIFLHISHFAHVVEMDLKCLQRVFDKGGMRNDPLELLHLFQPVLFSFSSGSGVF